MSTQSFRSSKAFTLIVVCIATFSDVFTYGVLVPVMPFALTERLGVHETDVQKWNSILLGVLGVSILLGSLLFGYASDRIKSRRLPFTLGLGALGAATILFALCRSLWLLLVARALQGVATAVVFTVGFALVFDKFGSAQLGQAMGYTSMSLSLGWFMGPVVGGIMYKNAGYLAVFAPPLVLVGVEIILRLLIIEDDLASLSTLPGRLSNRSSIATVFADEEAPLLGESQVLPRESEQSEPSQRSVFLTLLTSKRFVVAMFGFCIVNGLMIAFDGVLPVFVKEHYGFNSQQTSLTFLALTVPMLLSPVFGGLTDRLKSTKWPAFAGLALCVPGLLILRFIGDDKNDLALLVVLLVEIGLCFAIVFPPLAAEIMICVDAIEEVEPGVLGPNGAAAQAYGLTNAGLGIGCVLGPLGMGFVRVKYGWSVAVSCMAAISAVTALVVLPVTGGPLKRRGKHETDDGDGTDSQRRVGIPR